MELSTWQNDWIRTLGQCKPSDVIEGHALLACFHEFLQRGTPEDCFNLLPLCFKGADKVSPETDVSSAKTYFDQVVSADPGEDQKNVKVERLVRVSEHMRRADLTTKSGLLHASKDFHSTDVITNAIAIYRIITKLSDKAGLLYRHYVILFGDVVDQLAASLEQPRKQGEDRKSVAFAKISKACGTEKPAIATIYTLCGRYLRCAKIGGPGSLRSITCLKSDFPKLNEEDIGLLCQYRKDKLHDIERQSRALDFVTVKDFVHSLLAQGVEAAVIAKGTTRLTSLICRYVDTDSLAKNSEVLPKVVNTYSDEQSIRTLSGSPAGSASRINTESFPDTESPGSHELTLSYQASPHGQQQSRDVIETRVKGTKRRRDDRHDTPQKLSRTKPVQKDKHDELARSSTAAQSLSGKNTYSCEDPDIASAVHTLQVFEPNGRHHVGSVAAQSRHAPPPKLNLSCVEPSSSGDLNPEDTRQLLQTERQSTKSPRLCETGGTTNGDTSQLHKNSGKQATVSPFSPSWPMSDNGDAHNHPSASNHSVCAVDSGVSFSSYVWDIADILSEEDRREIGLHI